MIKMNSMEKDFSEFMEKKVEILHIIDTFQICFGKSVECNKQYQRLREELNGIRDILDVKYWDCFRLIIGCIDALTNTSIEYIEDMQIEALRKCIQNIKLDVDCSTVNDLLGELIKAGLKPVPDLQNYEEDIKPCCENPTCLETYEWSPDMYDAICANCRESCRYCEFRTSGELDKYYV